MTQLPLPLLREELDLLAGPALTDGQPSWTLHDPARNLFFRIDWTTFEILTRWTLADPDLIVQDINATTTLLISQKDVLNTIQFFESQQLLQPVGVRAVQGMAEHQKKLQGSLFKWVLHHYLFFRVPLVNPDAWLSRWYWLASWFFSRTFFTLTAVALVVGLSFVFRQWDVFTATLVDTFTFSGLLAYGVALFVVKCLHELGHAFTAKRFGCRIPAMGVAFLVMWPMAYTDTNETWRLTDRYERLKVASAGILTELVVAAWATMAWAILPDGSARSAFFVLATTSWIATLAINASPFMRFDGYFIMSDALDMPNLHSRSFALARWRLREWLFGLNEPEPEIFPSHVQTSLIIFAWATWLYRLVIFLGIALLVYFYFFKVLGVLLFVVELLWFIVWPVRSEVREWVARWNVIKGSRRSKFSLLWLILLIGIFIVPWPGRVDGSAILRPAEIWPVHAPTGARIDSLPFKEGERVNQGDVLLTMFVPDLEVRQLTLQSRLNQQIWQAKTSGLSTDLSKNFLLNQEILLMMEAEKMGLSIEAKQFAPIAPFGGYIRDFSPDLKVGQWVSKKEQLAFLVRDDGMWFVETWLDESAVQRVKPGDEAYFVLSSVSGAIVKLKVHSVDEDASRVLSRPELSAQAGGHILTREKNNQLWLEKGMYRVTLTPVEMPKELEGRTWRGELTIHVAWQIPAWRYIKHGMSVLVREFSF